MRAFSVVGLILFLSNPVLAQNAKGDKPAKNSGKVREARFKSRFRQGDRPKTRDVAGRRIRTRNHSSASRAQASYPLPKTARAARNKAKNGDKAGKPVAPIFGSRPRDTQRPWRSGLFGKRINVRSATGKGRNVYSNRDQLALLRSIQRPPGDYPGKGKKVVPRSASRAFIAHKSINPLARFSRKHKRGDQAILTDPAGRRLRAKNFQTPRPPVVKAPDPYHGRKRIGDRPYGGQIMGGYISKTNKNPRAWKGDITGRRIRGKDYHSKVSTGGSIPLRLQATNPRFGDRRLHGKRRGVGYKTATTSGEKRPGISPLPQKTPGIGAKGIGGLTISRKSNELLTPRRAGKSVSGRRWNNDGNPLPVRQPAAESRGSLNYQGNLKWKRPVTPARAGKSKSGRLWNNNESPLPGKQPSSDLRRAAAFQGNIKGQGPIKPKNAGKSVSGLLWNNKETPIKTEPPSVAAISGARYRGDLKNRSLLKPKNAGKSVSGILWNNKETPIKTEPPSIATLTGARYRGDIKLSRFRRNYIRNPNSAEDALKKARPEKNTYDVADIKAHTRAYHYVRNPSSAEDALKVREPGKAFARISDYQGNIRMKKFELFSRKDLHPDSKFVKINKNNVKGEKDALTGFKLWWSRKFKKNDEQPEHLKEKIRKPRYDKGEQGLWYD